MSYDESIPTRGWHHGPVETESSQIIGGYTALSHVRFCRTALMRFAKPSMNPLGVFAKSAAIEMDYAFIFINEKFSLPKEVLT